MHKTFYPGDLITLIIQLTVMFIEQKNKHL